MRRQTAVWLVIAVAILLTYARFQFVQPPPQSSIGSAGTPAPADPFAALADDSSERRQEAAASLRVQRTRAVAQLVEILDENDEADLLSTRTLAAGLLGDMQAISAVPALSSNLDYEVGVVVIELREFYMEAYPCAEAISKMGPSALKPTLTAIAKQEEPLTPKGARVAAYLIVSLCDNSKEDAIAAIRKAEKLYPDSKNLHPIRMYIEHFMDFRKNIERRHAEPSA